MKVTQALRVRLVAIDGDWDSWEPRLRELRDQSRRWLNLAISLAWYRDMHENGENVPIETQLYRMLREHQAQQELMVPGAMTAAYSRFAWNRFKADRKKLNLGDQALPSWKRPAPILIRGDIWNPAGTDSEPLITMKLWGGRKPMTAVKIVAPPKSCKRRRIKSDAYWWSQIRHIWADPSCAGDLKVVWDKRNSHWYALISYSRVVEGSDASLALGVHLGMTVPIMVATLKGKYQSIGKARELWAFRARMKELRRRFGQRSRGRRGQHAGGGKGWKRRNRAMERLGDREDRWLKTKCQQYAAAVVQVAKRLRCGTIVVGSYTKHVNPVEASRRKDRDEREWVEHQVLLWQPYRLRQAVAWTARREGLNVIEAEEAPWSRTCHRCGHKAKENRVSRALFRCAQCNHTDNAEVNAARNLAAVEIPT